MAVLRKIGVLKLALFNGLLGAFLGLIGGIIFFIMDKSLSTLLSSDQSMAVSPFGFFSGFGIYVLIAAPIVYGILGFLGALIIGLAINLSLKIVGGIHLDIEMENASPQPVQQQYPQPPQMQQYQKPSQQQQFPQQQQSYHQYPQQKYQQR